MKESGKTTKLMGTVFIFTWMGPSMKAIGRMIFKMDMELRLGRMVQNMKDNILKEKSKDWADTNGPIKVFMWDSG